MSNTAFSENKYALAGYSVLLQDDISLSDTAGAFFKGVSVRKYVVFMLLGSMAFGQLLQPATSDTLQWLVYENNQINLKLKGAGDKLGSARWGFYIGLVLNVAGTLMTISSTNYETNETLIAGISLNVLGLLFHCWAWSDIGYAGDRLRD